MIDYDEESTLRNILKHHDAYSPDLTKSLVALLEWVHASERAKHGGPQPVFLACLEGPLGLHCPRRGQERARAA